ncbi:MAG: sugar ABC transporter substrate-binding protein [Lachnospiraceae bacterium]|nr:sugar ABC transporter substrate-binding protein [Lachnospiraceae bacterium]
MSLKKRLTAVGAIAIAAVITIAVAGSGRQVSEKQKDTVFTGGKETLYLWYTDETLTSYLSSAAVTYNETHDVRIVPVLESGLEYLERINQTSLENGAPDLYIISHDSLEKACLAGLASEVKPKDDVMLDEAYIGTGLQAASYKDKVVGYPFYFETSSLLYNKTYLEDMAKSQLEAEADQAEGEAAQERIEEAGEEGQTQETETAQDAVFTEEQIAARVQQLLPATIQDIESFADNYDAPEQVEGVFKWDVTDIFYNYFFVGNSIKMGGEAGWDTSQIDIYNLDAIASLRVYQELNQFFSIDTSDSEYEAILDEFMAGKMVFTMATTDAIFKLEQAKEDGLFEYDYDITLTPDIDENRQTRSLSMTSCVVINGYSENKEAANDFAYFLTAEYNDILYARTGKVSAAKGVDYGYEPLDKFAEEYEKSISMPKMIETSNFWVKLEVVFSQIWNGADANEKLKELSEQIMSQVTGAAYQEEYLEESGEQEEEAEAEYLDGEADTQEETEE